MPWSNELNLDPSDSLYDWLVDPNSLTKKLKAQARQSFSVKLISEGLKHPPLEIQTQLNLQTDETAICREVNLVVDQIPRIYAQTWMAESTHLDPNTKLNQLNNQPIGELLFKLPDAQRSPLAFQQLTDTDLLFQQITPTLTRPTWARKSSFIYQEHTLLVIEVFLITPPPLI